jgi:hypothetical protein
VTVPISASRDYSATVAINAADPYHVTQPNSPDDIGKTQTTEAQDLGTTTVADKGGKVKKPVNKAAVAIAAVVLLAVAVACFFTVHIWSEATCTEGVKCILCGKAGEGEAIGHDWQEATCLEPATCLNCGETEGEALGHNWVGATCDVPEHCSNCGESVGTVSGHNWTEATYEKPKTCTVCGETSGNVKGWIGRVYGEWERFYSGGNNSYCYVLDAPMDKCKTYTLNITINSVDYGSVEGKWEAYRRDAAGNWVSLGYFELVGDSVSATFDFDVATEVYAVAAVIRNGKSSSYNWSLSVTDVIVYED